MEKLIIKTRKSKHTYNVIGLSQNFHTVHGWNYCGVMIRSKIAMAGPYLLPETREFQRYADLETLASKVKTLT